MKSPQALSQTNPQENAKEEKQIGDVGPSGAWAKPSGAWAKPSYPYSTKMVNQEKFHKWLGNRDINPDSLNTYDLQQAKIIFRLDQISERLDRIEQGL